MSGAVLYVSDTSTGLSNNTSTGDLILGNAALTTTPFTGNLLKLQKSGTTEFVINATGQVGSGVSTPTSQLHITRPLSYGAIGKAIAIFDQIESQDILTASASGATKFTIKNDGSASASAGLTIDSAGSIQTTNMQTLTLGGSTTGNISLQANNSGTGKVQIGTGNGGTTTPDLFALDVKSDTGDPTGFEGAMYYNTADNKFRCYEGSAWTDCIVGAPDTATFTDADPAAWNGDVNTVELFNDATKPNIVTDSTASTVLVTLNIEGNTSNTSADTFLGARLVFTTDGSGPSCTTSAQVGEDMVSSYAITTSYNFSNITGTFVHDPGGAAGATVKYTVCSSAAGGPTQSDTATSVNVSLVELGADLAENYYTKDDTMGPGDVVSIDSSLPAGVKKSTRAYDSTTIGVVSTNPGKTLDDAIGLGKGRAVPIALAGRIPVKVSSENGRVKAGDYLTPSSKPGIAMKATKAGQIIGQALENFSYLDNDIGLVMTFVKTSYFTGESVISQLPGLSITQGAGENALSNLNQADQILSQLLSNKASLVKENLSEIFTDRLVAGLEIITPKVTTEEIDVSKLMARDATISGTLTVDVLRVNKIEGLEFTIRNEVLNLKDILGINSASSSAQVFDQGLQNSLQSPDGIIEKLFSFSKGIQVRNLFESLDQAIFRGVVEFLGQVIFRNEVSFEGEVAFNKDTGGYAQIKKGQKFIEVMFEKEYKNQPVINISPTVIKLTEELFRQNIDEGLCTELEGIEVCQDKIADLVLSDKVKFAVWNQTTQGFLIILNDYAPVDMTFSWQAQAVKDVKTVRSDGPAGLVLPFEGDYQPSNKFGEHSNDPAIKDKDLRLGLKGHDGLDIAMSMGTAVLAVDDGEVELENNDYGTTIYLKHSWGRTVYGHLSGRLVNVGDRINKAQKIGLSGNSGLTTGPHLHFGIKLNNSKEDNGYAGFENPWHFLSFTKLNNQDIVGVSTVSATLNPSITPSPTPKPENILPDGLTIE